MVRRTLSSALVAIAASALVASGCGGSNPGGPSDRGVVLQGTVVSATGAADVSAHAGASDAKKTVVTVQENPSISATVAANGTFHLENLPSGTVTLVFTVDDRVSGTVTLTGIPEGAEVRIVVEITPAGVILISITIEGASPSPSPTSSPGTSACLISGGKAGSSIQLEGTVASGNTSQFKLDVMGNRASKPVDVDASGASWRCVGQSGDCKTNFRSGNQVHVSGLLNTCSAEVARVTASEVKVQKP
jgi:hypothetical protein